jgi:hypothetical protein
VNWQGQLSGKGGFGCGLKTKKVSLFKVTATENAQKTFSF